MKILMSGGGTGGHVYPAIAIANKIKKINPDAEILFVGTEHGIESVLVPKYGYEIKKIKVQGFKRKIDLDNVKRVITLFKGMDEARKIVKQFEPDIVIGTGGYVSGPILFTSTRGNATTIIHEQNSFPGVTNKILSTSVNKVLTSFIDSHDRFPNFVKHKLVLTGNPVRKEIIDADYASSRAKLNIDINKKMLLCYGGSGGSKSINNSMIEVIKHMIHEDNAFIFATGERFYDDIISNFKDISFKDYQKIVPYLDDMETALAASDIVIGSAGAISIAEITAKSKPSILIPKGHTAENHQEYNAKTIHDSGAGICILEKELTPELLKNTLLEILNNNSILSDMSIKSGELGNISAVDKIYDEIMDSYNSNTKHIKKTKIRKSTLDITKEIKPIKIKKKTHN